MPIRKSHVRKVRTRGGTHRIAYVRTSVVRRRRR